MPMTDKVDGKRWGLIGPVFALLLFATYMAAYYAIVGPYPKTHLTGKRLWQWQQFGNLGRAWPDETPTIFAPALWIDSRVRPDKWWSKSTDPLDG
jgi:hypothetical protein